MAVSLPADLARKIANDIPPPPDVPAEESVLVDLFAGVGGNTIAFALSGRWAHVIGIERDAATLACAQHNASTLYDEADLPPDAITWIHGDCLDFLDRLRHRPETLHPSLRVDPRTTVLFASPPWGGISYRDQPVFDLSTMQPYNLETLHAACRPLPHALYLPRTSDLQQIADCAPASASGTETERLEVVQYCMHRASKAMVVYYPAEEHVVAEEEVEEKEEEEKKEKKDDGEKEEEEEKKDDEEKEEKEEEEEKDDEDQEDDDDDDEDFQDADSDSDSSSDSDEGAEDDADTMQVDGQTQ